ncbi:MAG: DNA alkylation repair protein [Prevotella sp.]|nr:DNA alkylation repair protein [Prevotella sp.]
MKDTPAEERIREIKRSFRGYMDAVTARSLRDKGCSSKVVWGVTQGHLREIASSYEPGYGLAAELWRCDIRECKLLATMLMPADKADEDLVGRWIKETRDEELAEMLAFNLLQNLPYAPAVARRCLAADSDTAKLIALNLYARLYMKRYTPERDEAREFINAAAGTLKSDSPTLRRAAMNAIIRFALLGEQYETTARDATAAEGFDIL